MEEYNIRHIEAFQADYYKHGKYDLVAQTPHLAKLAAYYEKKYQHTQDWIDCVKVCCYHVFLLHLCMHLHIPIPYHTIHHMFSLTN